MNYSFKNFNYKDYIIIFFALILATIGWKIYNFMTDDAYISFRYISNMYLGRGPVWNPPPFHPVEGYTSFLWVIILYLTWIISGIIPPDSANYISLIFGYGSIFVVYIMLSKIKLNHNLNKYRKLITILTLLYIVSNRTFLTWLSSGLETSLFNYLIILWVYYISFFDKKDNKWQLKMGFVCSLLYLTRPDGLLFASLTSLYIVYNKYKEKDLKSLIYFSPIAIIPTHILWRKFYYGDWFPNTYYAKYVRAWPESGIKYSTSFIIEYGYWLLLIIAAFYLIKNIKNIKQIKLDKSILVLAILIHFLYYTLIIGGDHFEFRVYSHLTMLLPIIFVWILNKLSKNILISSALLIFAIYLSIPIPWSHWYHTKDRNTRANSFSLRYNVTPYMPSLLKPLSQKWFKDQLWLIRHSVCCRQQEHKIFLIDRLNNIPSRQEGEKIKWSEKNTIAWGTVGAISWVFPNVAVIDFLGLNDRVVSKAPVKKQNSERHMAHDRMAPNGYINCFMPSVSIDIKTPGSQLKTFRNKEDIATFDERIVECEKKDWLNLEKTK